MNFQKGMSRLALVLGIIGFAFGTLFAGLEIQSQLRIEDRASKFTRLAYSFEVQEAVRSISTPGQSREGFRITALELPKPTKEGVIKITFDTNAEGFRTEINSVETNDETYYKTDRPSKRDYLLPIFLAPLEFILFWTPIKTIGWVISGFISKD